VTSAGHEEHPESTVIREVGRPPWGNHNGSEVGREKKRVKEGSKGGGKELKTKTRG